MRVKRAASSDCVTAVKASSRVRIQRKWYHVQGRHEGEGDVQPHSGRGIQGPSSKSPAQRTSPSALSCALCTTPDFRTRSAIQSRIECNSSNDGKLDWNLVRNVK